MTRLTPILFSLFLLAGCAVGPKKQLYGEEQKAEAATVEVVNEFCNGRCEVRECYGTRDHGVYCRVEFFMVLDQEKEATSRLIEKEVAKQGHDVTVAGVDSTGSLWGLVLVSFIFAALLG